MSSEEYTFQTPCGHHGIIKPVRATGKYDSHWKIRIKGPRFPGRTKKLYYRSISKLPAVLKSIAKQLQMPSSKIRCHALSASSSVNVQEKRDTPLPVVPNDYFQKITDLINNKRVNKHFKPWLSQLLSKSTLSQVEKSTIDYIVQINGLSTSISSPSLKKDNSKQQYGKDVREPSPNNRATCKICRKRIRRGELRVGKWTTNHGFSSSGIPYPPCFFYYHDRCVSDSFRQTLKLPDPGIQEKRHVLLQERRRLREQLRQMRLGFARRLDMPAYCIFEDATLDDITVRLPRTKSELLLCHGIKEKRCRNFGEAILAITRAYNTTQMMGHSSYSKRSNAGDDDDTIQVTGTLSIEDIVSKKFRDAEENGYLIEL